MRQGGGSWLTGRHLWEGSRDSVHLSWRWMVEVLAKQIPDPVWVGHHVRQSLAPGPLKPALHEPCPVRWCLQEGRALGVTRVHSEMAATPVGSWPGPDEGWYRRQAGAVPTSHTSAQSPSLSSRLCPGLQPCPRLTPSFPEALSCLPSRGHKPSCPLSPLGHCPRPAERARGSWSSQTPGLSPMCITHAQPRASESAPRTWPS